MQRQSLVPLKSFMDKKGSVDGSGLSFLEVAGGTGRYATFVKVGLPCRPAPIHRKLQSIIACCLGSAGHVPSPKCLQWDWLFQGSRWSMRSPGQKGAGETD